MNRSDRPIRPLPTSLATLAALVAILAATSSLPEGAVIERSRGWIVRPIDEDGSAPGAPRSLSDCLALAARHLIGVDGQLTAAIAPLHANTLVAAVRIEATVAAPRCGPPDRHLNLSDLALPPPLA